MNQPVDSLVHHDFLEVLEVEDVGVNVRACTSEEGDVDDDVLSDRHSTGCSTCRIFPPSSLYQFIVNILLFKCC